MKIRVNSTEIYPTLSAIRVYVKSIDFDTQCAFFEIFYENEDAIHITPPHSYCMAGDDYANWTDDVPYVKTWILQQTGLEEA